MRILVTGATGFLGGAVVRRLHAEGRNVIATGRNTEKGTVLEAEGIPFVRADLADSAPQGYDIVIHSAALAAPWGPPSAFEAANITATANLLQRGAERFIHISTPSIYFANDSRLDVREDDPLPQIPVNDYARTKLAAEKLVRGSDLPFIILRPRAIYGPGDNAILPRIIAGLERGRLPVIGDGTNIGDFTYVDNVVAAVVACLDAPESALGRAYNITNGDPQPLWPMLSEIAVRLGLKPPTRQISVGAAMTIAGAMEAVFKRLPGRPEPPLTRYGVGVLSQSQTLNIEAARAGLGYRPKYSNNEGLERFIAWYKS